VSDGAIEHLEVSARGARFHVARCGAGEAIVFLHGWPEFWWTWEPVMARLADRFLCVAPDLRGFGSSDKPASHDPPWGPADHAADVVALLDALGLPRAGIVAHDVGGAVAQPLARLAPERLSGLFLFDFVRPHIGPRFGAPDRLNEIWYQSFHQMPFAPALVGASREACRAHIGHFLRHWSHRKEAWDDATVDRFVDNFLAPGNLKGGFHHYRAAHSSRVAMMRGEPPALPPITVPTCVRWAAHDPIFPPEFAEGLERAFAELDVAILPGVGHFPHREDPDRAASEIAGWFSRKRSGG